MSEQKSTQPSPQAYPTTNDRDEWKAYWNVHSEPWRTEPEIDIERQQYLAERLSIIPNREQGIYPFKNIKLSRADVEWLLATHEDGRGPVDWYDEKQQEREGLDLRGVDLSRVNLSGLPLARTCWGLFWYVRSNEAEEHLEMAAAYLEGADFREAHLEGSCLRGANLKKANLSKAHLTRAELSRTNLSSANLREVNMRKAILIRSHLEGAILSRAHLEGADFRGTHLEEAVLYKANLEEADLRNVFFNIATNLEGIVLSKGKDGCVHLAGVHWANVDLSVVNWSSVKVLGDEQKAHLPKTIAGEVKQRSARVNEYRAAGHANRQVAIILRDQGFNGSADYFAYRSRILYRKERWWQLWSREHVHVPLLWLQLLIAWIFSLLIDVLAGYGYKPERTIFWYLVVIVSFATTYVLVGHLLPLQAVVFSLTSFHGRGFSPGGNIPLDNPLTMLAAIEAVVGLMIEISLISTVTQKFFAK